MRIECKKTEVPLGVRDPNGKAYLFCPILDEKIGLEICKECPNFEGEHFLKRSRLPLAVTVEYVSRDLEWLEEEIRNVEARLK